MSLRPDFGVAEWMRGSVSLRAGLVRAIVESRLRSKERRSVVLDLIDKPCAKLFYLRHVECRFAANDPISELGRHCLVQGTNQTTRDQVQRRQRGSGECDALTGNSGIDSKRGLIEHRTALGIRAFYPKCSEPGSPGLPVAVVNQNVFHKISGHAN